MRKIMLLIAVFTVFISLAATPRILFAQGTGGVSFSSGTPEFNFQIPISGLKSLTLCEKKGDTLSCPGIAKYVQVAYTFLVGFAAVLAVLAITWGGVQWLISRGESGKIQEARKIIGNAVVGLIIALGSYTVLSVINPSLTQFNPLLIKPIKEIPLTMNSDTAAIAAGHALSKSATKPPVPSASGPTPGSTTDFPNIKWYDVTKLRSASNEYGDVYADILAYSLSTDTQWYKKGGGQEGTHPNIILDAHEHAHYTTGFYIGNGKTFKLLAPTKSNTSANIAKAVPKSLRTGGLEYSGGSVYESYISGSEEITYNTAFVNIIAELISRNAASKVGIEMHKKGLLDKCYYNPPEKASLGTFASSMENTSFIVFALAAAYAIEDKDSDYLTREPQFKDVIKFFIQDGRAVAKELETVYEPMEKSILTGLQKNADAKHLRDLAKRWYNVPPHKDWTQKWLGF